MKDINKQESFSNQNVEVSKPNVPKSAVTLSGFTATSQNGGLVRIISYKRCMKGEKHYQTNYIGKWQMLTPKTPAFQRLRVIFDSWYCPDSAVWKNADKFQAQRGGSTEDKITQMPNIGGLEMPFVYTTTQLNKGYPLCYSSNWRDSFISSLIPRVGELKEYTITSDSRLIMPKYNALILRGAIKLYNTEIRAKPYQAETIEYDGDEVTVTEWQSYLPMSSSRGHNVLQMRAKKTNSYYTDYRTEMQGFETDLSVLYNEDQSVFTLEWMQLEAKAAQMRTEAEFENLNTWEILAKLSGSAPTTEKRILHLGRKVVNLNYSAITQNTYNNNPDIEEKYRVLGERGAYSFTDINIPCYAGFEAKEQGTLFITATVQADTIYEKAFDRESFNVEAENQYKPDLKDDKLDVLYNIELDATDPSNTEIFGFKRKFTEKLKYPNIVQGDMCSEDIVQSENIDQGVQSMNTLIETNKTFTFFETDNNSYLLPDGTYLYKYPWLDYTDLQINKNLAIPQELLKKTNILNGKTEYSIKGQNQIFQQGQIYTSAELPIDPSITENYTQWGEH